MLSKRTYMQLLHIYTHTMFEKVLQITSKGIHHFINIIYYWRVNDVKRHLRCHVEICNGIFKRISFRYESKKFVKANN